MATQNFPSFTTLKENFLGILQGKVGKTSPLNDRAFLRACAWVLAIIAMLMQREVGQNTKENFAKSASREGLIAMGIEYGLPIKEAQSTVLNISLPTTADPTTIPPLQNFVSNSNNGFLYYDASSRTSAAGSVELQVTSRTPGTDGNLTPGQDTLELGVNIAGATTTASIVSVKTFGTEAEETEVYRQRLLGIIRAPGGGGNLADYRNWSEKDPVIIRAYPVSARPWNDPLSPGSPIHRTVYGEVGTDLDPDGIPNQAQLDSMREYIQFDLDQVNQYQEPMGLTNYKLYTEPIRRKEFFTTIRDATFKIGTELEVKEKVNVAVVAYFLGREPFTQGVDIDSERKDGLTSMSVGRVVESVLSANGAIAQDISFGELPGIPLTNGYTLQNGEKAKSGGVNYVVT